MAESFEKKHPVLAVVGPTATGKTALGVALAEQFGGEIISADSMQIYKGLDIGTAKVTPEETHGIPHHAVDLLEPDQTFSVADFTALAGTLETDLSARGKLPILVGGTGLYVQSFLYGVRFTAEKAPDGLREQLAAELAEKGPAALYEELKQVDPEAAAAIHPNNHRTVDFRRSGRIQKSDLFLYFPKSNYRCSADSPAARYVWNGNQRRIRRRTNFQLYRRNCLLWNDAFDDLERIDEIAEREEFLKIERLFI